MLFPKLIVLVLLSAVLSAADLKLPDVLKPAPKHDPGTLPANQKFIRTGPTIQIAILLDTSNSMDGLIRQAKEQIWSIVNEVSRANLHNKEVNLQVALYEYGKSSLPRYEGYMQMLSPLTNDLDFLSEKLFGLRTRGGDEYAGWVIRRASDELFWSKHPDDLRLVIIAGNESFAQGSVHYKRAIRQAHNKQIIVNTIFCGSFHDGIRLKWEDGAHLGGGKYMNINSDAHIRYIPTPYDDQIIALNRTLNKTYVGYGRRGLAKKQRQAAEDMKSRKLSKGSYINRTVAKSSKQYKTESWDAVSAFEKGKPRVVADLKASNRAYKGKSDQEIAAIITAKSKERKEIKSKIQQLEKQRRTYRAEHKPKSTNTFGEKIISGIHHQMEAHGYQFRK